MFTAFCFYDVVLSERNHYQIYIYTNNLQQFLIFEYIIFCILERVDCPSVARVFVVFEITRRPATVGRVAGYRCQ